MNLIAAKLGANMAIEALKKNGQIGSSDKPDPLTFDGSVLGTDTDAAPSVVKISDTPINFNALSVVRVTYRSNGEEAAFDRTMLETVVQEPVWAVFYETTTLVLNVSEDVADYGLTKGVYIYSDEISYVSAIEFVGEVKPIDPKYLPGVCLPVVTLTTVATAEGAALTDAENAQLNEVAATGLPIILKCTGPDGTGVRGVATAMNFGTETAVAYILSAELVSVQVIDSNGEGVWTAMFMDHD